MPSAANHDDSLKLASLDFLGSTEQLRAQAEQALRTAGGAPGSGGYQEGADPSDSIWVSVDPRGLVVGVEVSRQWRDRLRAGEFAAALFDAYTAAVSKSLDAAALAAFAATRQPGHGAVSSEPTGREQADRERAGGRHNTGWDAPVDAATDRDWLDGVWRTLDGVEADLRRLRRDKASGDSGGRETAVSSPQGYFTFRLLGRGIVGIDGEARRLSAAGSEQLRRDALAAFEVLQREAARRVEQD